MERTSKTSDQTSCEALDSSTHSPESGSGVMPSSSPDGHGIDRSGQGPAPASHSARQDYDGALTTSDTSGPTGAISLLSADLQSFLASRLPALTDGRGSTLYKLTWKEWVLPSGRRICALRASVPRTSGRDYSSSLLTGWPTPQAHDQKDGQEQRNFRQKRPSNLSDRVALTGWDSPQGWATPIAKDDSTAPSRQGGGSPALRVQAQLTGWATPCSKEAGGTAKQFLARKEKAKSRGSLQTSLADSGRDASGSTAVPNHGFPTGVTAQLNPAHSLWLIGLPVEWLFAAPRDRPKKSKSTGTTAEERSTRSATPSSPK